MNVSIQMVCVEMSSFFSDRFLGVELLSSTVTIWQFFRNCQISPKCQLHSHNQSICFEFLHILVKHLLVIVQSLSCVPLFVTLWTAAHQASMSFTISWSLLKVMFNESVMPSNHLVLCRLLLLPSIFPSIRVFSSESALPIRWPECWSFSFSFSICPSSEYSGFISVRINFLPCWLSW